MADLFSRFFVTMLSRGSFFGEYSIFFGYPSNFTYFANQISKGTTDNNSFAEKNSVGTWLLTVDKVDFLKICEDSPIVAQFLRLRSVTRRCLWRRIELELEQSLAEKFGFLDPLHYVPYDEWRDVRS